VSVHAQSLSRGVRRSLGWAAAGAVLAFSVADASPEFFVLVASGVTIAWLVAVVPARPAPTHAIHAGLVGVVGIGLLQVLRLGVTVDAFAYFIGLLLIVKLFDLRAAKDWGQSLVLVTALYISAVLTSNSMPTGVFLVLGSVFLLRAILRYQIFASAERGSIRTDSATPLPRAVARDLRSLQVAGGFAITLAALLVFLFLPRNIGADQFGRFGSVQMGQMTGFTDEVMLGGPGLISQSQTPVMDVAVFDRDGKNIGRAGSAPYYLRGAVLNEYDDGRWSRGDVAAERSFVRGQFIQAGTMIRPWISAGRDAWQMELRVNIRSAPADSPLFTVWQPLELRPISSGQMLSYYPINGVVYRDGSANRIEYTVRSFDPQLTRLRFPEGVGRDTFPAAEVPEGVTAYAKKVLEGVDIEHDPAVRAMEDDARVVTALQNHLQTQFSYTLLDEPVPPGREPTEWFLNERRTGHCEYYASALALMARSAGINARVITGYVASDFNEVTSQYVVRQSNAHGWVEAEVAPGQWMTFDGTPRADFFQIHQPDPSLWRSITRLYETAEFAWASAVVAYNSEAQRQLLGELATDFGLRRFGGRMIERVRSDGAGLVLRAAAVGAIVFALTSVIGIAVVRRPDMLRRLVEAIRARLGDVRARLRGQRADLPERLHAQSLRALQTVGVPKPPGTPLRAHLAAHRDGLPGPLADALSEACDLLYLVRFQQGPPAEPDRFRRARDAIRASENRRRSRA
jgi:hypothetical protein